jgi:O-antigen/teichoic acid export membrane protein
MNPTWKERLIRLLRRSERYTKTDMVYLAKGNFWLNINRGVSILNGLIISIAFANLLTKEEYGTYAFALAFLGVFSMAQTTGLASGVGKGIARGEHYIIFDGLKRILPWSLLGAVLLASAGAYYLMMDNMTLGIVFVLGALVLPVSISTGIAKSFFSFKGDFDKLARFNLMRTPIMSGVLIIAAWLTHSALWVLVASILGNVILAYFLYRSMRKSYDFSHISERKEPFATKFAFHSGILSIFGYLSEQLDDILLWKFSGAAPVAVYTYATTPVRELRSLIENQSALALPKFAQKEFSEVKAILPLRIKQMYLVAVPLTILYVLCAPFLFSLLFPQYMDAVALSQLAALSLLAAPRKLMSTAISAHQKIKESYIMIVLPSAIRIVIALILIPFFGIKGAILALLISEAIEFVIFGILIKSLKDGTAAPISHA